MALCQLYRLRIIFTCGITLTSLLSVAQAQSEQIQDSPYEICRTVASGIKDIYVEKNFEEALYMTEHQQDTDAFQSTVWYSGTARSKGDTPLTIDLDMTETKQPMDRNFTYASAQSIPAYAVIKFHYPSVDIQCICEEQGDSGWDCL